MLVVRTTANLAVAEAACIALHLHCAGTTRSEGAEVVWWHALNSGAGLTCRRLQLDGSLDPCVCGVGWDVCTPSPETVGAIHRSRERGFNHRTRYVYVRVHTSLVEIEIFMNAWPPVNLRA